MKNHEIPFPEAREGQKCDKWSKTEKALSVILREAMIAGADEEQERLAPEQLSAGTLRAHHWRKKLT